MRKRIIFLFLAVLLVVNSFCLPPAWAANTSNSLQDGDIITINSRGGHYYNYTAGANYATSYMVANLTKRADGTAVSSEKSYRAWCATYGEATPATGDLYRLEELDGSYYDDGLGLSISLSWALSCIKAAEALGAGSHPNNVWQMAIELAIRCKSDKVEVESFDFDTMSDSGFFGSTAGEELLERQGWTVKDFYVMVQNIYNRAVANPVTYRAPVTKLEYTKTEADVVESGQYILARYELNVSGASVTVTEGAEYGVTATESDGTVTVSIPVASLPEWLDWKIELSYTNENASYNMFKGVPVTASGAERSDVQKIMLYDTETVVLTQPLDGSYYNPYEVGSIVVKKTDADSANVLSGVPFEVYRVEGDSLTLFSGYVTDATGELKTPSLQIGQYLVVEGDYEGYEPFNPSAWTVTGDSGASYTTVGGKTGWLVSVSDSTSTAIIIYAKNKLLPPPEEPGYIVIKKTDADTGASLGNVPFDVYKVDGDSLSLTAQLVTNYAGEASTSALGSGQYLIIEGSCEGYEPYSPSTWTVTGDSGASYTTVGGKTGWLVTIDGSTLSSITLNAKNKALPPEMPTTGSLRIEKTSYDGIRAGFYFKLTGGSLRLIEETNSAGYATFSDLPIKDANGDYITYSVSELGFYNEVTGEYYLPNKYAPKDIIKTTLVEGQAVTSIPVYNSRNVLNVTVIKKAEQEDGSFVNGQGFTFRLSANIDGIEMYNDFVTDGRGRGTVEVLFEHDGNGNKILSSNSRLYAYDKRGTEPIEYTLTEIACPDGYEPTVDPIVFTVETMGRDVVFEIENYLAKGMIEIIKTSEDGVIEGVQFNVVPSYGESFTLTTDANGRAEASRLELYNFIGRPIIYTVTELDVPLRYIAPEAQRKTLTAGKSVVFEFHNELKKGSLRIEKDSEDGIIEGLKFNVVPSYGESFTLTTDADGRAEASELPIYAPDNTPISYQVEEIDVPLRYVAPPSVTVTLSESETAVAQFYNELKKGSLRIEKDSEDGVIEGLKFNVVPSYGESFTLTTDANGRAEASELLIYAPDNTLISYQVEELDVPLRYVAPPSVTVTLPESEDAVAQFYNELKKGSLRIEKDSEDGIIEGLKFNVVPSYGESFTLTTDADGRAEASELLIYAPDNTLISYQVEELDVPLRYVAPPSVTVTLPESEDAVAQFYNELKKGSLRIEKDSEDGVIEGLKFNVVPSYGESFTLTTDANGRAEASELLIYAPDNTPISYQVEELDVPLRYVTPPSVTVTLPESEAAVAQFYNELKTGSLTVYKTDQSGALMEGVEFTLQSSADGGTSWSTADVKTTGYGGKLYFDELQYGVLYRLIESNASAGYALQAGPVWQSVIGADELDAEITVRNNLITCLPFTGENGISTLVSFSVFAMLTLVGGQLLKRKKKPIDIEIS